MKEFEVGDKVVFAESNEILTGVVKIVYKNDPMTLIIKTEQGREYIKHPSQVLILQDSVIEQILKWFKDAISNPTYDDLSVQLGCHFEEVLESMEALDCDINVRTEVKILSDDFKNKYLFCTRGIKRCNTNIDEKIALVDAMGDQIVTAIGVLHMLGVDPQQVLKEIADSNDSKRNSETGEFDRAENGKIVKGKNYKKPNLKQFCE